MPEKPATAIVVLQTSASYVMSSGLKFLRGKPKTVTKRSLIDELKGNPRFSVTEVSADEDIDEAMAQRFSEMGLMEKATNAKAKVKKKKKVKASTVGKKKKIKKSKKGTE